MLNEALGGPRPHAECRNPEQLIAKALCACCRNEQDMQQQGLPRRWLIDGCPQHSQSSFQRDRSPHWRDSKLFEGPAFFVFEFQRWQVCQCFIVDALSRAAARTVQGLSLEIGSDCPSCFWKRLAFIGAFQHPPLGLYRRPQVKEKHVVLQGIG